MVSRHVLVYDTTNFYASIASTNERNELAQRGHNKQGRHNLRQVALSYVLDGESGLSLCHHVYPGDGADSEEYSAALSRITRMLDHNQIARETVTLVFDKGTAALANTVPCRRPVWAGFPLCRGIRLRRNCASVQWHNCRPAVATNPRCAARQRNFWCMAKNTSAW